MDQLLAVSPSLKSNFSKPKSPTSKGSQQGSTQPLGLTVPELCQMRSCPCCLPHTLAPSTVLERVLQSPANPFKEPSHGAKFVCKGSS